MSTKPKVAFFDFASCEGCQLQIANLEEEIIDLVSLVDLVEFREVMTEKAPSYDIAFVEGSITRKKDEARLQDIRERSGLLVALGACAATGGLNKLKNARGNLDQVYIKGTDGFIVLTAIGDEAVLTALAHKKAKLGMIFLEMRRAAEILVKLVG